MIEGILFLNGVLTRLFGLFLDTVGVLTTVGVFTIDLVLVPVWQLGFLLVLQW